MSGTTTCPQCAREWSADSEHAMCIEMKGACIVCKFQGLSNSELDEISENASRRARVQLDVFR